MTDRYVFDAEPLFAFLYDEEGCEWVAELLQEIEAENAEGAIAETNASELLYLIARVEGGGEPTESSFHTAERDLRTLRRRGLGFDRADWMVAGQIKADGGLSLADAYAVALALQRTATLVVGGDDDFDSLPVDVDVERFRDHGV